MRPYSAAVLSPKMLLLVTTMLVGLSAAAAQAQSYEYDPNENYGSAANETVAANTAATRANNIEPIAGQASNTGDLQLTVAVGVGTAPEYFGSDDYEAVFTPAVDLEYHNAFLVYDRQAMMTTYEGLGYKLLSNQNWTIGMSLLFEPGRKDDNSRIRGMGDVDPTALAGGFVSYEYGPAFARAQLHMDALNQYSGGYRGEFGAGVKGTLARDVKGMLETTARYGSENYNEEFFNVNGAQSAATGLPGFDSNNGFYQWGLGGTLQYNVTPGAFIQGLARYDRVMGDAADSPISKSDNQFFLGTNVGYHF